MDIVINIRVVDEDKCIGCGICATKCPKCAIENTFNQGEVFAAYEAKKAAREKAKTEKEASAAKED